jgi:hypothetical protein
MNHTLSLTSQVRAAEGVLAQLLHDELVLLNLSDGIYYSLDSVGARIWQLIQSTPSRPLQDILSTLVEEYETSPEQCTADLFALVSDLQERRLLELVA